MASDFDLIGTIGEEDDVPLASESSDSDLDVRVSNMLIKIVFGLINIMSLNTVSLHMI